MWKLAEFDGFPKVLLYKKFKKNSIIVQDYLGVSLFDLFLRSPKLFTLENCCKIAIGVIERIERLHEIEYIHRDIKPDNILLKDIKDFSSV